MRVYVYMYIYCIHMPSPYKIALYFFFLLCSSAQFPQKLIKLFCQSYKNLHFCNPRLPKRRANKNQAQFFYCT